MKRTKKIKTQYINHGVCESVSLRARNVCKIIKWVCKKHVWRVCYCSFKYVPTRIAGIAGIAGIADVIVLVIIIVVVNVDIKRWIKNICFKNSRKKWMKNMIILIIMKHINVSFWCMSVNMCNNGLDSCGL